MQDKQSQISQNIEPARYSIVSVNSSIPINLEHVNKPLKDMSRQEIIQILKIILSSTCSVCVGLLLQMLILSINLHFVGRLEDPIYLDAIGFSIVIINCTGGFFMMGFNQGTGTYIGRAHGKKDFNMISNYFYKGLFVLVAIYIFFSIIMLNCSSLLLLLGQKEELAVETQYYGSSILPGIFANYSFDLIRNYMNGQEIYRAPMIILALSIPFHYILCYSLFDTYGLQATIYSTNTTYFLILIISLIYLYKKQKIPTLINCQDLFMNIKEYVINSSIIALPLFIDILGFEINSILVGLLGDLKQFGAHVAFCNYTSILFSFPVGMGGAFMLLTSNAVGKNCKQSVKNFITISKIMNCSFGVIFALLLILFKEPVSTFYTTDIEIQQYFQKLTLIYALFVTLDFICQSQLGILKAIGKAKDSLYAFILAYYIIGVPASAFLGLGTDLQLIGFWFGFAISILSMAILSLIMMSKINVDQLVETIHQKLEKEQQLLNNNNNQEMQIFERS